MVLSRITHFQTVSDMKVNFGGINHSSLVDWDGYVVDVVFLNGCNMACKYCQNYDMIQDTNIVDTNDIISQLDFDFIDGVVFSGGECTLQPDALDELIDCVRDENKLVAIETNGTRPEWIDDTLKYIDRVFMDYKSNPNSFNTHLIQIGPDDLRATYESMKLIDESDTPLELRTTCFKNLIGDWEIRCMGKFIAETFLNTPTWVLQQGHVNDVLDSFIFNDSVVYSYDEIQTLANIGRTYVEHMCYSTLPTGRVSI